MLLHDLFFRFSALSLTKHFNLKSNDFLKNLDYQMIFHGLWTDKFPILIILWLIVGRENQSHIREKIRMHMFESLHFFLFVDFVLHSSYPLDLRFFLFLKYSPFLAN